jgi:hypothetical protein
MTSDTISQALGYAARGWPVFPCGWQGERRKHPLTQRGFLDASRDPSVIEAWWYRWPEANIGLPTGPISNFDALDVDPRHGGDESLAELEAEHGPLPFTIRARSPVAAAITFCFATAPALLMPGADYRSASTSEAMVATFWSHRALIRAVAPTLGMQTHTRTRPSSRTGRRGYLHSF